MFSNDGRMAIEQSYLERFSGDQPSKPVTSPDFMQDVLSKVPDIPINSSIAAGPTETQRSLEEAGEGNVTVAIPGMASCQVDGKAVEEGSSTETFPDPFAKQDKTTVGTQTAPDTATITLHLADGTSLDLTFRSNQTVKTYAMLFTSDHQITTEATILQSVTTGDVYRYLNVTVHKISTRRSTTLIQIFPDQ